MKKKTIKVISAKGASTARITIECVDNDNSLFKLLKHIQEIGNTGHSFSIIVDPDNKDTEGSFGWDGDGSDSIQNVIKEKI